MIQWRGESKWIVLEGNHPEDTQWIRKVFSRVIKLGDGSVDRTVESCISSSFPWFIHTLLVSQVCSLYIQLFLTNMESEAAVFPCSSGTHWVSWLGFSPFCHFCHFKGWCEHFPFHIPPMDWSDWVHGQQPLVRCECFLFVGPTRLKEAPAPRPEPAQLGQVSVAILRPFSPHLCPSDRQLTSETPGPASPSICPHGPQAAWNRQPFTFWRS